MAHKYHAQPSQVDGCKFDSKAEARRYKELLLAQSAGYITKLEVHPVFKLQGPFIDREGQHQRAITYEADFSYFEHGNGQLIVEDVKGVETAVFKLKRKMFLYHYPQHELRIIK